MHDHGHLSRRDLLRSAFGAATLLAAPSALRGEREQREVSAYRPGADLDTALRAERWIRSTRIRTTAGVAWPADPEQPESVVRDLYTGTPGVVLFLLELYDATGDRAMLDEAVAGARDLAANAGRATFDGGLYSGIAGTGFVLAEVWKRTGDAAHRTAALHTLDMLESNAKTAGAGVEWSDSADIISGTAGTALFLLYAAKTLQADAAVELATRAGHRLAELGKPAGGGLKWAISSSVPNLYPNFSHGTAGVAYALATLYGVTGERAMRDSALEGTKYLESVEVHEAGGCRVFHHEPGGENLFYLSWCHGGPGTARLYKRLADVTGDAKWLEQVHCQARGVTGMGAPVGRSPGYWENISQCCGNAGVGEFFLSLHRQWPERGYLDVARRAATDILRRSTEVGTGLKWVQAEHRVRPELLVAQTGRMQGAAGVGSFFLGLDAYAANRQTKTVWPDSPWT